MSHHILVIIGNDPSFNIDLSAFRGVREETGMVFTRLKNPTIKQLENHVRRLRLALGGNLPNVHIAAHMGSDGIQLQDGKVNPEKVSELLYGSQNVFLAGCESIDIGDSLSSIPFVLTMMEKISNEDALAFAIVFWKALGHGYSTPEAFSIASERLPIIAEFAYLHQNNFLFPKGK